MNTDEWYKQHQEEVCKKKRTFINRQEAKSYCKGVKNMGLNLRPYKCSVCDFYHVTTRGVKK